MAEKPRPKPEAKMKEDEQSQRFIEAARSLEIEDDDEQFEKAVGVLLPAAKKKKRAE